VQSGWVPSGTRVQDFESAIRTVSEPIFGKPIKDISFGFFLMRLFQIARRFQMPVQPQLVLLQKTLLQVEGLGRQLDPDLDLRRTAQPILERWMNEQMGIRGLAKSLRDEAPAWARTLPQLPRLVHRLLSDVTLRRLEDGIERLAEAQRLQTRVLAAIAAVLALLVLGFFLR
jgi:ubiquinone biosynthesis protein